ncbi:cytochrome P450 family protein [Celeribacter indicus]|uniref:Cytochrome P450 family protein n=2 Tax=Celeribacter indicus TaxID=1208324 RepID=A0A0B5DN95_9RHOB|nr:cytochrome P450 family protein [Celeribacter indicus]
MSAALASAAPLPPKPAARAGRVSLFGYLRLFRRDILSAQPGHLFRAWMAEMRTPFFRSFLCNDPELVHRVLRGPVRDFPKSERVRIGLRPLLRSSVFISNGALWEHQRRIIDPAFEGGRLREVLPAMWQAGRAAVARLAPLADGRALEIEAQTSHVAMDVIFRALFSQPIESGIAQAALVAFRDHQAAHPVANAAAILPFPKWVPRCHSRAVRASAARIRTLIVRLTTMRAAEIAAGTAPDDLATRIMTTPDPETGRVFDTAEMVDQVAIFFLAGHETSAAALAWALYLLATHPDWQERVAAEAGAVLGAGAEPDLATLKRLETSRAVFREALRLYPPVPMYVREAACPMRFRARRVPKGAQIVISPWHLHRHERIWENPDGFDPARWKTGNGREGLRLAYIPFSEGPRVCPGAGFAMAEGPLLLSMLVHVFRFDPVAGDVPVPAARLTLRSADGIRLRLRPRLPTPSA